MHKSHISISKVTYEDWKRLHDLSFIFEWRWVNNISGWYLINNIGVIKYTTKIIPTGTRFFQIRKTKIMKTTITVKGYVRATLRYKGEYVKFSVHRLVAISFIPNPENKPEVNHKDMVRWNNNYLNLEWATTLENQHHAHESNKKREVFAPMRGKTKSDKIGKPVGQYNLEGKLIKRFNSYSEASRETRVNPTCIAECIKGFHKTSGGFIWK